jgi:hypothetical protein
MLKNVSFLVIAFFISLSVAGGSDGEIEHNAQAFIDLYRKYVGICSIKEENMVMPRHDRVNLNLDQYRNWSLEAGLVHQYVGVDFASNNPANASSKPEFCSNASDISYATSLPVSEYSCRMSWYSSTEICEIIHRYSLVYWLGDSLTRHMMQAFMILIKEDLRYGGIPYGQQAEVYDKCGCDGQFTEAFLCRKPMTFNSSHALRSIFQTDDLRSLGLCSSYRNADRLPTRFIWVQGDFRMVSLSCPKNNDSRPIFVFFQGGHFIKLNAYYGITTYVEPFMLRMKAELADCWDNVRFVFSGATVCQDAVVRRYPHQDKASVQAYNRDVANWLKKSYPKLIILDFWNLSAQALDRTSDGFHQLTDVNLIKASTVLNLMHQMSK